MEEFYFNMLVSKPKLSSMSPLEKGDHAELCTSKCLDQDGIQKYQSLIGAIQWAESLGRLDLNAPGIISSYFRDKPTEG